MDRGEERCRQRTGGSLQRLPQVVDRHITATQGERLVECAAQGSPCLSLRHGCHGELAGADGIDHFLQNAECRSCAPSLQGLSQVRRIVTERAFDGVSPHRIGSRCILRRLRKPGLNLWIVVVAERLGDPGADIFRHIPEGIERGQPHPAFRGPVHCRFDERIEGLSGRVGQRGIEQCPQRAGCANADVAALC